MIHNSSILPFQRSQSAEFPNSVQPRILLTHSASTLPSMSSGSFQRRTVESARQIRDSLTNVIREIEPLVETARSVNAGVQSISISSFLNRSQSEANIVRPSTSHQDNNSTVINLEEDLPHGVVPDNVSSNIHMHGGNFINNPDHNSNNNNPEETTPENEQTVVQAQEVLRDLLKYVPFILILLAKAVYDYHEGIFIVIILFVTFNHSNNVVKKEATKREKRSISTLAIEMLYIFVCLMFIHYFFEDDLHNFNIVLNLILIRTFTHPLTVWNLLWIVMITDFILKLITINFKILLTMFPAIIVEFKKRGKIYLFIEALSQLYRSIATVQPWLYYLLECYQGPEKIVAVFLSAFYMISKGTDLMSKVKLLKTAFYKLLQNVSIGSSPSKDQILTAGEHCPICHDEYDTPVLLQCRHIFCETCVSIWFDREQTCPLCRAKIVDDPSWRDGSTSYFLQLF